MHLPGIERMHLAVVEAVPEQHPGSGPATAPVSHDPEVVDIPG